MNHDEKYQAEARERSFARAGLVRSAQARPVVLTATQAQMAVDNHHDQQHHNHHNHHNHHSSHR